MDLMEPPTYHENLPDQFPNWVTSPRGMYLVEFFEIIRIIAEDRHFIGNLH